MTSKDLGVHSLSREHETSTGVLANFTENLPSLAEN